MANVIEIIFAIIYIPIVFTIATFLLYKAIRVKANNIYPMSFYFYLNGLDFIFVFIGLSEFAFEFYAIFNNMALIFLILFIKLTFFRDKKSAFPIIITCFIILRIIELLEILFLLLIKFFIYYLLLVINN